MHRRSYNQYCGLAYALDLIGARWTLLIVRELFAGPRRFKDLLEGLPGISTNLLTERLKDLEQHGLIQRRTLPPPAGSAVYELTALGRSLEPMLLELGRWGAQFVPPVPHDAAVLGIGSYALTPMTFFRPELAQEVDATYALHIDGQAQQVQIRQGAVEVRQGEPSAATAALHTTTAIYLALLAGQVQLEEVLAAGQAQVEGDINALSQFFRICQID